MTQQEPIIDSPEKVAIFVRRAMLHVAADTDAWLLLDTTLRKIIEDPDFLLSEILFLAATKW